MASHFPIKVPEHTQSVKGTSASHEHVKYLPFSESRFPLKAGNCEYTCEKITGFLKRASQFREQKLPKDLARGHESS
jgi:hypothetical protein